MRLKNWTLVAAAAGLIGPACADAASVVFSYTSFQTATDAAFTSGVQNVTLGAGNVLSLAAGQYFRFGVLATVTGNPNSPEAIANGAAQGAPQPAELGLTAFGGAFANSNVNVAVPQSVNSASTAVINPKFNVFSLRGAVNPANGDVGTGDLNNQIAGGFFAFAVDAAPASSVARLTLGTSGTVAGDNVFTNLSYRVPTTAPLLGQATLTSTFLPSSLGFVRVDNPGTPSALPSYSNRSVDAGDTVTGPGPLTIVTANPLTLTTTDAIGESSFNAALHWSPTRAPLSTDSAFVGSGLTLRTPDNAVNSTFNGRGLTVGDNGANVARLVLKNANNATVTINNLVLNKGLIQNGSTSTNSATAVTLAGSSMTLGAGGGTLDSGAAGRTLTVTSPIGGNGALAVIGGGTVALSGANTYTGATTVAANTRLRVTSTAAISNVVFNTGGVDLADNGARLELVYLGGGSPAANVRSILAAGFNSADPFSTSRIRSTTLAAGHSIGYADNATTGVVTVRVTFPGDADLDGGVSINDFNALAANFGQASGRVWTQGDFDYDGGVSINDFNLLAGNFGRTLPAGSADWSGLLAFAAAHDDLAAFQAVTGVPEPTAMVAAGALVLLAGRRRRSD